MLGWIRQYSSETPFLFLWMQATELLWLQACSCRFGHQRSPCILLPCLLNGLQEAAQTSCKLQLEGALWHVTAKNGAGCLGGRPASVLVLKAAVRELKLWLPDALKLWHLIRNNNTSHILFTLFQPSSSQCLLSLPYFLSFMSPRDLLSGALWTKTVSVSDLINFSAIFSVCRWFPLLHNPWLECEAPPFKFTWLLEGNKSAQENLLT